MLENLTDDQLALLGCAIVLVATGLLMSISHHIGRFARRNQQTPSRFSYEAAVEAREAQATDEQPLRKAA